MLERRQKKALYYIIKKKKKRYTIGLSKSNIPKIREKKKKPNNALINDNE